MIVGNYIVDFDEETHTYYVNGNKTISVTQLLQKLNPNKYQGVSEKTLLNASKRGLTVHNDIQVYEENGLESNESLEFRNYKFLKDHYKWQVVVCEKVVVIEYKGRLIAGRFDQLQMIDGKFVIADVKNTASLDKESLAIQLNLYRLGFQQCYEEQIEGLKGIWLYKDKRKYVDIPINPQQIYRILDEYIERNKKI